MRVVLVGLLVSLVFLATAAVLLPPFLVPAWLGAFSETPPLHGEPCDDSTYSTHVELSGSPWCEDGCNGARCVHPWPVVDVGGPGRRWHAPRVSGFGVCFCQ